jgi:hypothetical protein
MTNTIQSIAEQIERMFQGGVLSYESTLNALEIEALVSQALADSIRQDVMEDKSRYGKSSTIRIDNSIISQYNNLELAYDANHLASYVTMEKNPISLPNGMGLVAVLESKKLTNIHKIDISSSSLQPDFFAHVAYMIGNRVYVRRNRECDAKVKVGEPIFKNVHLRLAVPAAEITDGVAGVISDGLAYAVILKVYNVLRGRGPSDLETNNNPKPTP